MKSLKDKIIEMEKTFFSGAVKTAENAVTQQQSKPMSLEEKEAVHDVAILTGVVDSVAKDLKQVGYSKNFLRTSYEECSQLL
jgi:hypothetical protein